MITGNAASSEKEFLSLEDLIREARAEGVKNREDYHSLRKSHPKWPSLPNNTYKGQWKGWGMITGNAASSEKEFLSLEDLIREARAEGVNSQESYNSLRKSRSKWPSDPKIFYKSQWKGWAMISGNVSNSEKEFLSLEDLIREARAEGVKNREDYNRLRKSHPKWPSLPNRTYEDQWEGFKMISGNVSNSEKEFLSLEDLIREARAEGVKNKGDYRRLRMSHPKWPSTPSRAYKDQWKGWADITGSKSGT